MTARALAREMERRETERRWRRDGLVAGGVVGVVLLALLFVRLGQGSGASAHAKIRLAANGLTVNGAVASIGDAILASRAAGGADVTVVGDARQGDVETLIGALRASGLPFTVRG
jgi:hypothetical protein